MGLKELYELLKGIQANKAVKTKQLEELQVKVKAATDEDLESLKSQVDALSDEIDGLITEETDVQSQIDEADESLKSLSKELEKAKQKEKGTKNMDYLKSKEAAIEYAKMLVDNQGKSNKDMQDQWSEHLKSKGVTGFDNLLPEPVLLAIQEEFKDYAGVLNHVTKDPRYSAKIVLQAVQNFAKGHKAGKTKKNADFSYTQFTINSATVYIKVDFDYADLKKDTNGTYFNYAMQQLAKGFIRAVERAIVIGDGLAASHENKITEIKSIAEESDVKLFDTQEVDVNAAVYTNDQIEAITTGVDKLYPLGDAILVTTKAIARKLKISKDTDGKYLDPQPFAPISQTGNNILGYTVYVYDWMNGAENPIIGFADKAYALIGDDVSADKFDQYDVTVNKRDIELASVMGGRLAEYKSAIKFTAKTATGVMRNERLRELKDLLEVDVEETIFDAQLLLYANAGIAFLRNNAIPVMKIDSDTHSNEWELVDDDYNIVLAWLHLYCLQRFDRTLMTNAYSTTVNWIDNEMTNLIYQLKVRYDHEE